ncbi:hypothetical protein N0X72_11920 [Streptomyces carpaticus]|uniref:hypothetical protein n=1 Tax=Streptomyces TaxID=1883 RepID=UPI00220439C6|nr:hypothetical protein N0X72_11920 [Streptomyces carpaticus]
MTALAQGHRVAIRPSAGEPFSPHRMERRRARRGSAVPRPPVRQADRADAPQTRVELPFPCV